MASHIAENAPINVLKFDAPKDNAVRFEFDISLLTFRLTWEQTEDLLNQIAELMGIEVQTRDPFNSY